MTYHYGRVWLCAGFLLCGCMLAFASATYAGSIVPPAGSVLTADFRIEF